jgi:hypothetical protein
MISNRRYLCITIFLAFSLVTTSQGNSFKEPLGCKPPKNRELFHDYVDREQKNILHIYGNGKTNLDFIVSSNEEINYFVTRSLINKVDAIQCQIEKDSTMGSQVKVKYLKGLETMLKFINGNLKGRRVSIASLPRMIEGYEMAMQKDKVGESIEQVVDASSYEVGNAVVNSNAFEKNQGIKISRENLIRKYCALHPDRIFQIMRENPNVSFLDSIIKIAAYKYPRQLYDYAAANNKLGYAIRKIDDPLIKTVSKMATSGGSGQLYFPFLDNILKGKMNIEDIDEIKRDSIRYYKLLVQTKIDYVERAFNKDTAYEMQALSTMLEKKAAEVFVNIINGLHDQNDVTRFRIIQQLNAQELYYLIVSTDGIIYTSSFVKGVYPLMMSKANQRGDSILMLVKFDKYRKFIKMAAGYNMLSNFLASFPDQNIAETLMRAFVGKLEQSGGLEDGVDVADSYASIVETIKPLADQMLVNIKLNYDRNFTSNNKRGIVIYNLLNKLFLSADTTNKIDLSKEFGIAPVYEVPFNSLTNDSGRVIMQVFFYGDKDGKGIFPGFLNLFTNSNWKIDRNNPQWVTITSVKGKSVTIYANKPLPEEGGFDEKAQKELCDYIETNKLYPTITIHRGHSYYAESTIAQMFPTSKIVFLGSCGGYHLIHDVLEKAPDAHIISTKQIADAPVNQPFFQLLTDKVRNGNNIDWIPFWKELDEMVTSKIFEDYIPPYKNLGAIFIKAYKIAMGETGNKQEL